MKNRMKQIAFVVVAMILTSRQASAALGSGTETAAPTVVPSNVRVVAPAVTTPPQPASAAPAPQIVKLPRPPEPVAARPNHEPNTQPADVCPHALSMASMPRDPNLLILPTKSIEPKPASPDTVVK